MRKGVPGRGAQCVLEDPPGAWGSWERHGEGVNEEDRVGGGQEWSLHIPSLSAWKA